MTLHREKEGIVFECDDCGEMESTGTSNFEEARDHLTQERWRTVRRGDAWVHLCRGCK